MFAVQHAWQRGGSKAFLVAPACWIPKLSALNRLMLPIVPYPFGCACLVQEGVQISPRLNMLVLPSFPFSVGCACLAWKCLGSKLSSANRLDEGGFKALLAWKCLGSKLASVNRLDEEGSKLSVWMCMPCSGGGSKPLGPIQCRVIVSRCRAVLVPPRTMCERSA
jgi:hypothetical protein